MNASMNVQVIMKDGEPEYAILPYAQYQALLQAARQTSAASAQPAESDSPLAQLAQFAQMMAQAPATEKTAPASPAPAADSATAAPVVTPAAASASETPVPAARPASAQPAVTQIANSEGPFSGEKVAQLRTRKGLDAKTLARGIGISPLYLSQIETGERMPGDAIWHNIARELQVSMADLKAAE